MQNKFIWIVMLSAMIAGLCIAEGPPNFLFIISDDQSFRAIGSSGNEVIQTPNLDRLADSGMTFTHGFNMGSYSGAICVASRAMLNTGRYVWQAEDAVGTDALWGEYFQEAGYDTFLTGKWHVLGGGLSEEQSAAKAFETAGAMGKGFYGSPTEYNRPAANSEWAPDDITLLGHWSPEVWDITNGVISAPYTVEKHTSELYADEAVHFLNARVEPSDPFFMYVSFNAPHDPRQAPTEYQEMYSPFEPPIPPNLWGEYPYELKPQRDDGVTSYPITETVYKFHLKEYYAMISHMDDQIGRILAALEASGEADNTYVIFTSDHGLAIGEHGYIGKQILYDHSTRVPFLMKGPEIEAGSQVDAMFYLQSIVPTTLELAGIPVPPTIDFPSLTGLMNGTTNKLYDSVYGGLFVTGDMPQRMIRTEKYKLIMYPYLEKYLLYDLEADPWEATNLLTQTGYGQIANDLYELYQGWQAEVDDPHVMPFIDFSSVHVDDAREDQIVYSGTWSHVARDVSVEKTISINSQAGGSAELTLDGVDVRIYTQLGAGAGIFDIYLDEVLVDTYDCYALAQEDQVLAFERKNLSAGHHVIKIVNTGTHNVAGNGGINVHLDMITYNRTGVRPAGLVDRTDEAGAIMTSEYGDSPVGEGVVQLFDNEVSSHYVTSNSSSWVQHQFADGKQYSARWYTLSSPEADPLLPAANHVMNGSFENGISPWSGGTVVVPPVLNGSSNALMVVGSSVQSRQTVSTLDVGTQYQISVWINASEWSSGKVVFDTTDVYDSTCQFIMSSKNGGWTEYTGKFTATSSSVQLRFFVSPADGFSGTLYIDDVSIKEVQLPPETSDKDPASWTLSASNDGSDWTVIDQRSGVDFVTREQTLEFSTDLLSLAGGYDAWASGETFGYEYYRLDATNNGGSALKFSEVELLGYAWERSVPADPVLGGPAGDPDGDGRDNLYEYALNGDPAQASSLAVEPTFVRANDDLIYTHLLRNDDPNLTYQVELATNLVSGGWVPDGLVMTTNRTGGEFDEIVHRISTDNPQAYIRLKITNY